MLDPCSQAADPIPHPEPAQPNTTPNVTTSIATDQPEALDTAASPEPRVQPADTHAPRQVPIQRTLPAIVNRKPQKGEPVASRTRFKSKLEPPPTKPHIHKK